MPGHDLLRLRQELERREQTALSPLACPSAAATRRRPDPVSDSGHRLAFAVDADRVLHSLAYTRYIDKTQVFSLIDNDHISHRVLHVQLVSKIGRTVGRLLGLNEDLIEAIALAHDLGHPPFGHDGEGYLSALCQEHGLGPFLHNIQSVRFLESVERGGRGLNLSLQVLDGVLCHDGEVCDNRLTPRPGKDFAALDAELAAKQADPGLNLRPMTMEGCVVRLCDAVAYVGRDLEDAISIGLIDRDDLPAEVARTLGRTNGAIVYRLVEDLAQNSLGLAHLAFSDEAGQALAQLKRFNLERIYLNPKIKTQHHKIAEIYRRLFEQYLGDLGGQRRQSPIFAHFLDAMDDGYRQATPAAGVVRDFISSMTDDYFLRCYRRLVWPERLPSRFGASG